jgi:16S rRNA (uracil1498-N3)-methyltransferase
MQQYFVDQKLSVGTHLEMTLEQSHHIATVLRMKEGKTIRLVDVTGVPFYATVSMKDKGVKAYVTDTISEKREPSVIITLAVALIKNDRFEWMLEKATECGVYRIIPFISSRCVVKDKPGQNQRKMERFRKIITEAAEQSYRHHIPEILEPVSIKQLKQFKSDINVVAYEKETGHRLSGLSEPLRSVTVIIGPEGGFETSEIDMLNQSGFECVSLGNRILRAETAAISACITLTNLGEYDE